jgi:alcohol dehydrogenase (NADP+)
MGATVTAISHSASKKKDAEAMGATHFIATHDGDSVFEENRGKLDLIICTTNDTKMPLQGYLSLLKPHGHFVFVRAPHVLPLFLLLRYCRSERRRSPSCRSTSSH